MTRSRHVLGHHVALSVLAGPLWPAVAAAAESGKHSLIEINGSLIVQLISFLVLLAVLYRFVYKPLVATLDARSAAIKQQLAEAQAAREAAQRQLAEFEAKLQAAQAEAQTLRERALREAAELRERLTAEAGQEATPAFHPASIMFWAQRPASKKARGESMTTQTAAAAAATCWANRPKPESSRRRRRSRTTTKCQGCVFLLLPLMRPACKMRCSASSGMGVS